MLSSYHPSCMNAFKVVRIPTQVSRGINSEEGFYQLTQLEISLFQDMNMLYDQKFQEYVPRHFR